MPRFPTQSNSPFDRTVPAPSWVAPSGSGFVVLSPAAVAALGPGAREAYLFSLHNSQFVEKTPEQILALTPANRRKYAQDRLFRGTIGGDNAGQPLPRQRPMDPATAQAVVPVIQNAIGTTGAVLLAAINGADLNEREAIRARTAIRLAEIAAGSGRPVATGEYDALSQTNTLLTQQPAVGPSYDSSTYGTTATMDNTKLYLIGGAVLVAAVGGYVYMNSQKRSNPRKNPVVRVGKKRSKKFIPAAKLRQIRAKRSRSRSRSR